ncbi:hypothetical protein BgiMline_019118 [Biomphalaria glabrata]|nr:hypothetical protein; mitochondrial [Biomphalaria glabrata]
MHRIVPVIVGFTRNRQITKLALNNTRCLQCALSHSTSSLASFKFSTCPTSKDFIGSKKNIHLKNVVIIRSCCGGAKLNPLNLSEDSCPQGVQGDDCTTFKLWLDNCQRYGLANCNDQLQGIQTGRKTLAEVLAEQEKMIAQIAEQYRAFHSQEVGQDGTPLPDSMSDRDSIQGCQENVSAFPQVDTPCPQGVQGSDCARFKLWLENCHRFGFSNCSEQFQGYKEGKKTLAQIFEEQDKMIREAAAAVASKNKNNTRSYSTLSGPDKSQGETSTGKEPETDQLTQGQKLKRAVKEYGSTVIVFHVSISLMSLGFFYLLVSSGIDVVGILKSMGVGGTLLDNKLAAGTGTFVIAYAVHKVFAPVRIATTLTATPFIVRYLRRIGVLKVPSQKKS